MQSPFFSFVSFVSFFIKIDGSFVMSTHVIRVAFIYNTMKSLFLSLSLSLCIASSCSVGPQLLYPSPYAVTPPGLMQLHPQSHHQAGAGGLNSAAASAAVAAAVASGFYDYPTAAYAASQFAANGGFDTTFPFGGAAAAAAAAGKFFFFSKPTFANDTALC